MAGLMETSWLEWLFGLSDQYHYGIVPYILMLLTLMTLINTIIMLKVLSETKRTLTIQKEQIDMLTARNNEIVRFIRKYKNLGEPSNG